MISLVVFLFAVIAARAQTGTTAINGVVTDPQGAVIVGAKVTITAIGTGTRRTMETDSAGHYQFMSLQPGSYRVIVEKQGFRTVVHERVDLLVSTTQSLDAKLEIGEVTQTVQVSESAPTINATDATVGNPFDEKEVKGLPFLARNVVNLLTLQPGVVFSGESDTDKLSMGSINNLDERDGAVNGVRGNQTNVTVDGVDSNDWQNQAAFTSALPVTLDSVQEFRVTTTGANASEGVAGGAQVALVTKSGSNEFHGNARWYYRTTGATADSFFNNRSGIGRPKLQRHIPGGSLGGPIIKDRFFFFLDNEERREASDVTAGPRIVPTDTLRDGVLIYTCADPTDPKCAGGGTITGISGKSYAVPAGTFGLGQSDIQNLDPAGTGINPSMLPYMNLFPHGNDVTAGRDNGLNFIGFRFNAPVATKNEVFTARLDYNITKDGRHAVFARGILGQIKTDLTEGQFPGQPVSSTLLNNSRGTAVQYQGQFRPNLINTFRWGFTRLGAEQTGVNGTSFAVRSFDSNLNFGARGSRRQVPVHEWKDDVTWVRGTHTLQFGGSVRRIRNRRVDLSTTFPGFLVNNGFCQGLCGDAVNALSANGFPDADSETTFTRAFMMLTGSITQITATAFADPKTGKVLPLGSPERRQFAENDFDVYAQDSWRIRPHLTLTAGLRWGYASPPWETKGSQVRPTVDIMQWFQQRIKNMNAGIPSDASPLLSWGLAGKANGKDSWYDPYYKDFAPRLSLAYSPGFSAGLGKALFGGSGKSSIRLGAGIYYSRIGQALAVDSDLNGSPGTGTALINNSQGFCLGVAPGNTTCASGTGVQAPRFAGSCNAAGCTGLPDPSAFLPVPTSVNFPFAPNADTSNLGFAVDPHLRTPYSINLTMSFQRELTKSLVLDVSYVGTFGRRLLGKIDYAQYLNIRDPKSKTDLWSAYRQVASLVGPDFFNPAINPTDLTALSKIKSIPFFDNLTPNMPAFLAAFAGDNSFASLTPTQAFYSYALQDLPSGPSWSCALFLMDLAGLTGLPSPWNTTVDPQQDGFVLFQPQFSALNGWTNFGNSNFHSLQVSVRKSVGRSVFTANYVYSKSIDNTSGAENGDLNPNGNGQFDGLIQNPFDLRAGRAASDFDLRHNINANWLVTLPFGHGERFGANSGRLLNALIGGWEITGAMRWRSGFPLGPEDGFNFPTNFFLETPGTIVGRLNSSVTRNGANNRPNLFSNVSAALAQFAFTGPGLPGSRNVFRSPAYSSVDAGVNKAIKMPWSEKQRIQFRVSAFNVFNSVNFSTGGVLGGITLDPTSPSTFGQITSTAGPRGGAREMEFAIRYEF